MVDQPPQRLRRQQRYVARQQDDGADRAGERGFGLQESMTRAELGFLERKLKIRPRPQGGAQGVRLMADDDHDRGWRDVLSGTQHVLDKWQTGGRMEHLRQTGFHPRALAGGKDHEMDGSHRFFRVRARVVPGRRRDHGTRR